MFKLNTFPNLALSHVLYNRWWAYEIRMPLVFLDQIGSYRILTARRFGYLNKVILTVRDLKA